MAELDPCDLVLEGGVTSAVIYAGLIARLSRDYRFKNLGGTSAGAVAAAAAAIAELARTVGNTDAGFEGLKRFVTELAETDAQGRTALFKLFQPQRATRPGFEVLMAALRHGSAGRWGRALLSALGVAVRHFPVAAAVGALPGLLLVALGAHELSNKPGGWPVLEVVMLFGALVALALGALTALARCVWRTVQGLVGNVFGLCTGMPGEGADGEAMTPALHRLYNALAGRKPDEKPVLFGELWGLDAATGVPGAKRVIDLQMITTALNLERPFRIPNDPGVDPLREFFYDPKEWRRFFPASVMDWLQDHPRLDSRVQVVNRDGVPLLSLPVPAQWPVVLGVRLSVSFPGLLSAVPMYTLDRPGGVKRHPTSPGDVRFVATRVYFTDGGITSNCPVQLFDVPLPSHPTFGVNLMPLPRDAKRPLLVQLASNAADPELRPRPFDQRGAVGAAVGFVNAILSTGLNWRDSLQRTLPGYRERIVHVGLKPGQGGLNLAMPRATILRLSALGSLAARRLRRDFAAPRVGGAFNAWDQHRWLRLRSTLTAAQIYAALVRAGVGKGAPDYRALLATRPPTEPRLADAAAVPEAQAFLDGLSALAEPARRVGENTPEPAPQLRMTPPW